MTARFLSQAPADPSTMDETPARGIIVGMLLGAVCWVALFVRWLA